MQVQLDCPGLVRCVACHATYEQTVAAAQSHETSAQSQDGAACPNCGEVAWLAAWIPFEETAASVSA